MTKDTPKNGFHIEYYGKDTPSPGEKWKEGNYKDGKKTGLWIWWYSKLTGGLKSKEENYKDGQLNGLTKIWDTVGKIFSKTNLTRMRIKIQIRNTPRGCVSIKVLAVYSRLLIFNFSP